ncbi:MAG: nucleotidyltransferase family protein [Candidatus Omnitrophica bacterium]|nr:nucleotidyltransferase family protein [Candidatus Omnitrophota bacterium]
MSGRTGNIPIFKKIDHYLSINFSFQALSPEEKLINLYTKYELLEGFNGEISKLLTGENIDWEYFLGIASANKIEPVIYKNIQPFGEKIPFFVKEEIRKKTALAFGRNVENLNVVKHLSGFFEAAKIEALFIKGFSLMMDAYREPGVRVFSDVDVLIKEEDFSAMANILKEEGFIRENKHIFHDYRSQTVFSLGKKFCLDVHTGFLGRKMHDKMLGIDMNDVFARKREIDFKDFSVYTLDLSHTLVYLCLHLSLNHSFAGLIWYVDIDRFVRNHSREIDWNEIIEIAEKHRIKKPLFYTLLFTEKMFATPIPDHVFKKLEKFQKNFDKTVLTRMKEKNSEIDYMAEILLFDNYSDITKFVCLSFARYPYLIPHFFKILFRMI